MQDWYDAEVARARGTPDTGDRWWDVAESCEAAVRPWGFDVASITVPVLVYQGRQDAMVPFAHGQWLAHRVPGAQPMLLDGHGHLSIAARVPEATAPMIPLVPPP